MNKLIVLIPVFKNKNGLKKSLLSLSTNSSQMIFDVLVIDDSPEPELESFDFSKYPFEVTLLVNGSNLGIIKSLNIGLEWIEKRSNYKYFARLDAGDEAINDRLVRQIGFLEQHPDCVLISGAIQYTSSDGEKLYTFRPPVDDKRIRAKLHLNNFVPDAAAMMRVDSVLNVGGYSEDYPIAEGYDIAWKLSKIGKLSNLAEVILNYEVSPKQTSRKQRSRQIKSRILIQCRNFDFACLESYWGIVKSILAFFIPWTAVIYFKSSTGQTKS